MISRIERPGGPLREGAPFEIDGHFYDPLDPPKKYVEENGKTLWIGGTRIPKDDAYSQMFWNQERPEDLKKQMEINIDQAILTGIFMSFVDAKKLPDGSFELSQDSKEKLSAYRVIAKEKGYSIDSFEYHDNSGTALATISETTKK